MTLLEMKKKVLQLIEEIDNTKESLTNDPDIEAKINSVINQVMNELARMKKIPAHTTRDVAAGQIFDLRTIENFYQLRLLNFKNASGESADYELIENMAVFSEDGTATIFYFKYPETITDETPNDYVFELSQDALEIMPYGVAADILKNDVSTNYGAVYSQRYETMLQRLDPRYATESYIIEGGVNI